MRRISGVSRLRNLKKAQSGGAKREKEKESAEIRRGAKRLDGAERGCGACSFVPEPGERDRA